MTDELQNGRDATFEERATWGKCPICEAEPGEWCNAAIGIPLGINVDGCRPKNGSGAHLARLQNAPIRIKIVGC